jgi:plasmid stabilization system protein ParE
VVFTPEAEDHLDDLYRYIAEAAAPEIAAAHIEAIITYSEGLAEFPHAGRARHDIRSGLRTMPESFADSSRLRRERQADHPDWPIAE